MHDLLYGPVVILAQKAHAVNVHTIKQAKHVATWVHVLTQLGKIQE